MLPGVGVMTMSNRSDGNQFESYLCRRLYDHGFWTHNLAQNKAGQPADIIAVRNGRAFLIDAKACTANKFCLSRVEANQQGAMTIWKECGNQDAYFAVRFPNQEIYMVPYSMVEEYIEYGRTVMTPEDLRRCPLFWEWVEEVVG